MEQTKNEPTKENKAAPETGKPKKEREPLTEAQRLKRQKMIVLPAMVLVFIGAMWLIFAPSSGKEQPPGTDGYNTEMPDADKANRQIIGDKLKAYEHGEMEERQESRNRAIGQLGDMFDREIAGTENGVDFDLANPGGKEERAKPATPQTIQSSAAAYRDLNATLGNFYDQPKNDNAEMDELLERIASLESELESERGKASSMDEQVALMEKSYELAAKYMGGQNGGQPSAEQRAEPTTVQKGKKNKAMPIRQVEHQVVSSLSQPMSNAEFVAALSQERNRGFNTAVGTAEVLDRNTIPACVHGAQSVTDGQTVRLRLLEPMAVAGRTIPRGAVVVGTGKIQGERLDIEITSLEYDGTIIPVELAVYDTDGHTASSDVEGSLGGLVAQAKSEHLEKIIDDLLDEAEWCSGDPLCMTSTGINGQGLYGLNYAACHQCTLLPETSCAMRNLLLDRAALIGRTEDGTVGFFIL